MNTSQLATRFFLGSFFYQAQAVDEVGYDLGLHDRKMPDEAPRTSGNQATGKVTKYVVGTDWESYTEQLDF